MCPPESVSELEAYVERMRPLMAMNSQTVDFIGFLAGRVDVEKFPPLSRQELFDRWVSINASMLLMPEWARDMTGTHQGRLTERVLLEPSNRLKARIVRWAHPEPPCKAMALERALISQGQRDILRGFRHCAARHRV